MDTFRTTVHTTGEDAILFTFKQRNCISDNLIGDKQQNILIQICTDYIYVKLNDSYDV
jgi:hypothetical protein